MAMDPEVAKAKKRERNKRWWAKKLAEDPHYNTRKSKVWQKANPERVKEYRANRLAADPNYELRYNREYREKNRERVRELAREVNARRREKVAAYLKSEAQAPKQAARFALNAAVRAGRIQKPTNCSSCGEVTPSRRLHGHHKDYSKPFDVVWLCAGCHGKEHQKAA